MTEAHSQSDSRSCADELESREFRRRLSPLAVNQDVVVAVGAQRGATGGNDFAQRNRRGLVMGFSLSRTSLSIIASLGLATSGWAQSMTAHAAQVDGSPGAKVNFTLTGNAPIRFVVAKANGGFAESGTADLTGSEDPQTMKVLFTNSGGSGAYQPVVGDRVYMINYSNNQESNAVPVTSV